MEEMKCKRCGRILSSEKSIKLGYGRDCYRLHELELKQKNGDLNEILDRIRKLELDNNFMKHQLKNKTFTIQSTTKKDENLDWDVPKEIKEIKDKQKIEFTVVIKELKLIFKDDFNYKDVLKPVNTIVVDKLELLEM